MCQRVVRKLVDVAVFVAGMKLYLIHALTFALSTTRL